MKKVIVSCSLLVAMLSAFGDEAAFARSGGAKMRLDTRTGTRLAAKGASETIAYVTVPSGKTLTIAPGAVVKFMTGTSLTATGTCMANGPIPSSSIPIMATSALRRIRRAWMQAMGRWRRSWITMGSRVGEYLTSEFMK